MAVVSSKEHAVNQFCELLFWQFHEVLNDVLQLATSEYFEDDVEEIGVLVDFLKFLNVLMIESPQYLDLLEQLGSLGIGEMVLLYNANLKLGILCDLEGFVG